jgi:hypothetical protein
LSHPAAPDLPIETLLVIDRCYQTNLVLKWRVKARTLLASTWVGKSPAGSEFDRFYTDLRRVLPKAAHPAALYDSIAPLAGQLLTLPVLDLLVWRLVGNIGLLRAADPVPVWRVQQTTEWVPVFVESAKRTKRMRRMGYTYGFRILAGPPAGLVTTRYWSDTLAHFVGRQVGFARRPRPESFKIPSHQYQDPRELVMLRMHVLLEPKRSDENGPGFMQTVATPSDLVYNRRILDLRDRIQPEAVCPLEMPREFPCYRCPMGYRECPAATHAQTYQVRICRRCENKDAFFSPGKTLQCVDCDVKDALANSG